MTKEEIQKLLKEGKAILRAQHDARKSCWKIVKATGSFGGGWARFGNSWFSTREDAVTKIKWLSETYPNQYVKED